MNSLQKILFLGLLLAVLHIAPPALAAATLEVDADKSVILPFYNVERVAVANPDIADVTVVSSGQVILVGKKAGITSLQVWTDAGLKVYDVMVHDSSTSLSVVLNKVLGYTGIRVTQNDKTIILEGTVNSEYERGKAEKVAAAYNDKVINLLQIDSSGQAGQIKIEAKIVQIDRDKLSTLGVQWANGTAVTTTATESNGGVNSRTITYGTTGVFGFGPSWAANGSSGRLGRLGDFGDFDAQLNALITHGYATVMSQPNVITLNRSKANIMVGGSIPIPVDGGNNQVTIDWKEYGIKLQIEPELVKDDLILSKIAAEVSQLDYSTGIKSPDGKTVYPGLSTDKVDTQITLPSGQSMIIGGLLSTVKSKNVEKTPLLGDIPLIGNLFKNTATHNHRQEVVIIITPTLISDSQNYQPPMSGEMRDAINNKEDVDPSAQADQTKVADQTKPTDQTKPANQTDQSAQPAPGQAG